MKQIGMIQKVMDDYEIVSFNEFSDIYVVNTCTVTNMSDRKSRQILRRCKEINPNAVVVAVGCYAEVARDEIEKIPEVDLILGNSDKVRIKEVLEDYFDAGILQCSSSDNSNIDNYSEYGSITYTDKTRAVIKVQDGCNQFCSYCIIPYARGRIRSRNRESVLQEIHQLAENGYKEVVITGIHVASYGKDKNDGYYLIDLLEDINKIDGLLRIRLGSLEPTLITDEFVNRISKLNKMCHHFHLSLQSGCDKTLKNMNRKYTTSDFKEVVERLRNAYNDVILTTDIIVGFPGESEDDFNNTYNFLKDIKFYKMHVFKYSPRKGTVAAKMNDQISPEIKEKRSKELIKLSDENELDYLKSYVGKNVEVLFEEVDGEFIKGHTQNYILVKKSGEGIVNCTDIVKIIGNEKDCLIG